MTTEQTTPAPTSTVQERLPRPERGDRLEVTTDSLAFEGKAVARRGDGYVLFVEGALAGERVLVEVRKAKSNFAETRLVEVITPGPDRRPPLCPYFSICGGCSLQHLNYAGQLRWKRQQVIDLFERVGKIPNPPVRDVLPAADEYHYRNKMEFSFSDERWLTDEEIASGDVQDRFALGLHVRERYDRVIDTQVCFLPKPIVTDILNFTRRFARENKLGVYTSAPKSSEEANDVPVSEYAALLRFLVVKTSYSTGEIMVNLVTSREEPAMMEKYSRELVAAIPGITTIINNVNPRRAQVAVGDFEKVYHGDGTIRDWIGKATFRISANSFFQSNTPQAQRLYEVAAEFAELRPEDHVWDLYCGTGTIALFIAEKVESVLGIELVESAIADARSNAEANGISNVEFVASDLKKALTAPPPLEEPIPSSPKEGGRGWSTPSVLIIDPPRSGMHPDVIREILKLKPERISYISCNPATQARDVALLAEGYELLDLQPVDMFPQTYHIECVAKLRRRA